MDDNLLAAEDLRRVRTPFVIVGGVATTLYMPQRLTQDLDILVIVSDAREDLESLLTIGRLERQAGEEREHSSGDCEDC